MHLGNNTCAIACAIYQDLYTDDEKPYAAKHLAQTIAQKGYHIDCGILGMKYIFTALSEYGYAETVYKLVTNPEYPSYANWINGGMTTLCETWDMKASCNHHMYSEIDMWFYKHIAGIQINEGGESVTIKPCFIESVDFVNAKYMEIKVYWDKKTIKIESNLPGKLVLNEYEVRFDKGGIYLEL